MYRIILKPSFFHPLHAVYQDYPQANMCAMKEVNGDGGQQLHRDSLI